MSTKKEGAAADPFVMHRRSMYESDAWRSLGKVEMKILARLEIELMDHAGKNNGGVICTYDDFANYGIRRPSVAPGLRNLSRVGLLVVTQRGRRDAKRNPHHYLLTYLPTYDEAGNKIAPTDEWRSYRAKPKKRRSAQKPGYENVTGTGNENVSGTGYENVTVCERRTGNKNDPTIYNLPIYSTEAEARAEVARVPKPTWATPQIEALYGIGHNRRPALSDGLDIPEDLSIPSYLRREVERSTAA